MLNRVNTVRRALSRYKGVVEVLGEPVDRLQLASFLVKIRENSGDICVYSFQYSYHYLEIRGILATINSISKQLFPQSNTKVGCNNIWNN